MLNITSNAFDAVLQSASRQFVAGHLVHARATCLQILAIHPAHSGALHLLGLIARQEGDSEGALKLLRQAYAINGNSAELCCNLALVSNQMGLFDEGLAAARRALELKPEYADAFYNAGNALGHLRRFEEAVGAYRSAVALQPRFPLALYNLGAALKATGTEDEAMAAYEAAIESEPAPETAVLAHNNLGNIYRSRREFEQAIVCYRRAIQMQPEYAEAHHNLAFTLLLLGDFAAGWPEFEWRKRLIPPPWCTRAPAWDGSALGNRTLLLHVEQGFGDTILCARYAQVLKERFPDARILVACQPALFRLLCKVPGIDGCFADDMAIPPHDVHCLFMTLPLLLKTTATTIPQIGAYLAPIPEDVARWRDRVSGDPDGFRVGLAWTGNPNNSHNPDRSIPLAALAALGDVAGVTFYSLQKGAGAEQVRSVAENMRIIDHTEALTDFAETAALIANLDLVIAVDSAVAHLAAAMGKEVWVPLAYVPDWRYGLEGDRSPWFPSMRLFRRESAGDWGGGVAKLKQALQTRRS